MNLGPLIRRHRKSRKLTLKEVAEKAGISEGFMSQVENSVKSPSVDTLMKICNAIGVNAGDVMNQMGNQERLIVVRKQEWVDMDLPHTGFATRRFFQPENRTVIDTAIIVLMPGKSIPVRKNINNGQELLCILQGSLELVRIEETIRLFEGDIVHYWSDKEKQKIVNPNNEQAIALWIGTL
jgi:transcriptional regulator with XRE-family HTH domain